VRKIDTEIILHHFTKSFVGTRKPKMTDVFGALAEKFDGAYNINFINAEGAMVVARDPLGFRPLCYSVQDDFIGAASESVGLLNFVKNGIKDINPGELLKIENGSAKIQRFAKCKKKAHCMFEYVYFANAASVMEGRSVYKARLRLGRNLARNEKMDVNDRDHIVVAVPDTARPAADSMARNLGIGSLEGLIRNRYVGRTFIEGMARDERVKEKYNINKSVLKGKKVILVEDSIVRGTTSKSLVNYIRKEGKPAEVHLRVSCPPIKFPCFYGIDMSTTSELIASKNMMPGERDKIGKIDIGKNALERIRKEIGVDSLQYQTINGLVDGIKLDGGARNLCTACLTGEYPTYAGNKLLKKAQQNARNPTQGRTYE
ncbi:MAG: phosphoribosyltransferase family protein, partial [Candidatus Diapherotrites archaeon]